MKPRFGDLMVRAEGTIPPHRDGMICMFLYQSESGNYAMVVLNSNLGITRWNGSPQLWEVKNDYRKPERADRN